MLWFESNDLHRHLRVTPSLSDRPGLRASLRAARRGLSAIQRDAIAVAIASHLDAGRCLTPNKRVGLYLALPDEIPTEPLLALAQDRGCKVYLPRIIDYRACTMRFIRPTDSWRRNRYGILEPTGQDSLPAHWLDLVFLPALGVDPRGARLGHGAGFYDRALNFRRHRQVWRGPKLIVVAADVQRIDHIPEQPYDVRCDAIVTESGITPTARNAA